MRWEYDPEVRALYCLLTETAPAYGVDVRPGGIAHYDARHHLVGVELLDVADLPNLTAPVIVPAVDVAPPCAES